MKHNVNFVVQPCDQLIAGSASTPLMPILLYINGITLNMAFDQIRSAVYPRMDTSKLDVAVKLLVTFAF